MKRHLIYALSILLVYLTACNSSTVDDEQNLEVKIQELDSNLILFPNILPDSTFVINNKLILTFVDSMPIYNAIMSNQAVFVYAMQMEKPSADYDSILFSIKMPNRDKPLVKFSMSLMQFREMEQSFSNYEFKQFLKDILKLNYTSRNRYSNNATTMLDGLNMIFAQKIESSFKEQIPNNSTWFGFNSYVAFGMYFSEISSGKVGIGHELINAIYLSKDRLNEYDKKVVLEIIKKHAENFKPKSS